MLLQAGAELHRTDGEMEIHRNAGAIVQACAAIKNGVPWQASDKIDLENGDNLMLVERETPEQILAALGEIISRLRSKY